MRVAKDPLHIRWAYSLVGATRLPVFGPRHPLYKESLKWTLWSGSAAVVFGLSAFLFWQWWTHRVPEEEGSGSVQIVRYTELGVPPSLARQAATGVNVASAVAAPPEIMIPEPVPDELASAQTIMTQAEIAAALAPVTASDMGWAEGAQLEGMPQASQSSDQDKPIEIINKNPVKISMERPDYPEIARAAQIEGTVMVKVRIGKDGRVKKAEIMDGPKMLQEAALSAARTAVFQPATMNGRPVEVWVAIPIRFNLNTAAG